MDLGNKLSLTASGPNGIYVYNQTTGLFDATGVSLGIHGTSTAGDTQSQAYVTLILCLSAMVIIYNSLQRQLLFQSTFRPQ
jgi:hypothetical protein